MTGQTVCLLLHDLLYFFEDRALNDGGMMAFVKFPAPEKIPVIKRVFQELFDTGLMNRLPNTRANAVLMQQRHKIAVGIPSGGIQIKDFAHKRDGIRISGNNPSFCILRITDIFISKRGQPRVISALRFLSKPLLGFLRQIINEMLGHHCPDAEHKFLIRPGVFVNLRVFLHKHNVHVLLIHQIFKRCNISKISGKAVGLLN